MYRKICLNCGDEFIASHDWKTYCIPCFIKIQKAKGSYTPNDKPINKNPLLSIDDDMLMRIIRLCHPDRHKNNEASNKATAFLLALRAEIKGEKQ